MKQLKAEEWRRKLVAMRNRGIPLDVCAEKINKGYNIAEKTVRQQWYDRKNWILEVFDLDYGDTEKLINDLVAEKKTVKEVLWEIAEGGSSDTAKIRAIKQINEVDNDLVDMLQSLGLMQKEPESINIKQDLSEEIKGNEELKETIKKLHRIEKGMEDN